MTFTRKDITTQLMLEYGLTEKLSKQILEDTLDEVVNAINEDKNVLIQGFGKFSLKAKSERYGRDIRRDTLCVIPRHNTIHFTPSYLIKDVLNGK